MDKTAIQTSLDPAPAAAPAVPVSPKVIVRKPLWWLPLSFAASLRVTVVLFALAIFLVFAGTLAQVEGGLWTTLSKYFRTPVAWIPLQVFVKFGQVFLGLSPDLQVPGSFPFPGGQAIGSALLLNLIAAHLVRFKLSWKRSGIILLHSGLIILMLGELVVTYWQVEGSMVIAEGESVNHIDIVRKMELSVIDRGGSSVEEVIFPESFLRRQNGPLSHDSLPFEIVVDRYMVNSNLVKAQPGEATAATAGDGLRWKAIEEPEVSGTDPNQKIDVPSAYLTFRRKDNGESLGTYLVSLFFYSNATQRQMPDRPQRVTVDGKDYDVYLRFQREYKPYSLYLIDFRHDKYLGTNTPKNYSSQVRVLCPERNENRETLIRMNEPLFYQGETFYQSSFLSGDTGTVLQVVRNPGWIMPYIACTMVALGMLVHFSMHLVGFLSQKAVVK